MTMNAVVPAGFSDKVLSSQSTFRAVMDAMARPGNVQTIVATSGTPAGLYGGTAAVALTLFDHDTPIWLEPGLSARSDVATWLRFHTGAPVVDESSVCSFALIGNPASVRDLSRFSFGSQEYPDRSTTLIVQVESLSKGRRYELRGPGIEGTAGLQVSAESQALLNGLAINESLFPRGIDVILVCEGALVALPRTTRLTAVEGD